ncbi:MAG: hypothetical protein J3K34DRAFT_486218 [Monoraphidium minutum]|nr:MAG: hypothetical protein J3K34DRAFT_486218 [Monoraphidium minutum]
MRPAAAAIAALLLLAAAAVGAVRWPRPALAALECDEGEFNNAGQCDACSDFMANCQACQNPNTCEECSNGAVENGACPVDGGQDPHLRGFNGADYEFCAQGATKCHGRVFNLVTERNNLINVEVDRLAGAASWPAAGIWLTGLGVRHGSGLAFELRMREDAPFELTAADGAHGGLGGTRALDPAGPAGGIGAPLAAAPANGRDVLALVGSGKTERYGACSVHYPASRHAGVPPRRRPVAVITTPEMRVTWFLESEDTWHLDFTLELRRAPNAIALHGLLGQSLRWARGAPAALEGGDEMLYAVPEGGLLGYESYEFNLYGGAAAAVPAAPAAAAKRRLLAARARGGGARAGTTRAFEAGRA